MLGSSFYLRTKTRNVNQTPIFNYYRLFDSKVQKNIKFKKLEQYN